MSKNKIYLFYLMAIAIEIFLLSAVCLAEDIKLLPEFTKNDRLLILAPHPDDEAIATGGLIQRAIKAGAKVKLALYTNATITN